MTKEAKLIENTIQKNGRINDLYYIDEVGPGNAYHEYHAILNGAEFDNLLNIDTIYFQKGPRECEASSHGLTDQDLLEIVRHRMECFQQGEFANEYNEEALEHIIKALEALNRRTEDRIKRGVLGTYNK